MKAAIIDTADASGRCGEFADPVPDEGETEMEVLAAGIHPVVRSLVAGTHYGSDGVYPRVPGVDCVARGADGLACYAGFVRSPWGTLAERVAAPMGIPLPDGADPTVIAGSLNPGLSSWMPLVERSREVDSLGTVVVVGATGVSGRLAVQNALMLGADRVIGLGRDEQRLAEVARLGGTPITLQDGPEAFARTLGGTSPTLILDYAWGPAAELVWEALATHGLDEDTANTLHVEVGTVAGLRAALPGSLLRSRRITVRGSGSGSGSLSEIMTQLPLYMQKVAGGGIVVPIRVFPLSRVADAWAYPGPDRAVVVPD